MHERLQRQLQIDGAEMQERSEDLRDRSRLGEAPSKGRPCISAPSTLPTASKVASVARMQLHPSRHTVASLIWQLNAALSKERPLDRDGSRTLASHRLELCTNLTSCEIKLPIFSRCAGSARAK